MSQPYFDSKSLLALGVPKHTVDALKETFERTGGAGIVTFSLTDLQALTITLQSFGTKFRNLEQQVKLLQSQSQTRREYSNDINQLRQSIDDLKKVISKKQSTNLVQRIEAIEARIANNF